MRKCIDMGEGREIIINDKDMLKLCFAVRYVASPTIITTIPARKSMNPINGR